MGGILFGGGGGGTQFIGVFFKQRFSRVGLHHNGGFPADVAGGQVFRVGGVIFPGCLGQGEQAEQKRQAAQARDDAFNTKLNH